MTDRITKFYDRPNTIWVTRLFCWFLQKHTLKQQHFMIYEHFWSTLDDIVVKNIVATMRQLGSYCCDNGDNDDNCDNGKSRDILHRHGGIFAFLHSQKWKTKFEVLKWPKMDWKLKKCVKKCQKISIFPFVSQNPPKTTKNSFFFYKKKF